MKLLHLNKQKGALYSEVVGQRKRQIIQQCRKVLRNKDFPAFPVSMNVLDLRFLLTLYLTATAYVCHGPFLCLPHSGRKMHHSS